MKIFKSEGKFEYCSTRLKQDIEVPEGYLLVNAKTGQVYGRQFIAFKCSDGINEAEKLDEIDNFIMMKEEEIRSNNYIKMNSITTFPLPKEELDENVSN